MADPSLEQGPSWRQDSWVPIDVVPRSDDAAVQAHLEGQRPVVLQQGSIVPVARWEDLEALTKTMAKTEVLVKRSARLNVAYFKEERNTGGFAFDAKSFVREEKVPFKDFVASADAAAARGRGPTGADSTGNGGDVLYCQETFTGHPELENEFSSWDWTWAVQQCQRHGWGLPETNVMFMGTEGASTPAHFDEQHNFLNQVRGQKAVILFPPTDYTRMYPFPVTHPCDRCSMVDVQRPDLDKFPRFAEATGHYTVLNPGDVLYIPYGWWHYCSTLTHLGASITFWSLASSSAEKLAHAPETLGPNEWARARRNLEKLLAKDVGEEKLSSEALRIVSVIRSGSGASEDLRIVALRNLLGMLQVPEEDQLEFLDETFSGRFGFDLNDHV